MPAGEKHPSPEKRAFARTLSELRQERHLTQETLAFESGYHPKYISLLERGLYSPSLTTILELAEVLQISGAELLGRVEQLLLPRGTRRERARARHVGKGPDDPPAARAVAMRIDPDRFTGAALVLGEQLFQPPHRFEELGAFSSGHRLQPVARAQEVEREAVGLAVGLLALQPGQKG